MNPSFKHISRIVCVLLVSLYTAIYVGWDMVHASVHQDEAISHSAQVESDPCHRSVFHGEQDSHKNHITVFKNCASCHVVSQPPIFTEVIHSLRHDSVVTERTTFFSVFAEQPNLSLFSSRAPPRIV